MITTMRLPLYIMLESDNVDRSKVVKILDQVVIPQLTKMIISYANKAQLSAEDFRLISEVCHLESIRVIDASQALDNR